VATTIYVRQRVDRAILARLKTITKANGYSTDVVDAIGKHACPSRLDEKYQIWTHGMGTRYEHRSTTILDEISPTVLFFGVPVDAGDPDALIDPFICDIQRALQTSGSFYIPYPPVAPDTTQRQIQVHLVEDDHEVTERAPGALWRGYMLIEVRYSRLVKDPAKWDSNDNVLTE
jgi:hypothetical protein